MATGRQSTGFLDLPPEIRNFIYGLVFPCAWSHAGYQHDAVARSLNNECCQCFDQEIFQFCRQMRNEALSLQYAIHRIHLLLDKEYTEVLRSWTINAVGNSISLMRQCYLVHTHTGIGFTTIDLAGPDAAVASKSLHCDFLGVVAEKHEKLLEITQALPRVDGKQIMTGEKLLAIFDILGWID